MIDCETETPNDYPQVLKTRAHTYRADMSVAGGGHDSAPDPHDYFDSALAACKTLTVTWYAKKNGIPLERVESHVQRDASGERAGKYALKVELVFHGAALTDEHRKKLHAAAAHCPIHKLMTTSEVTVETVPLPAE